MNSPFRRFIVPGSKTPRGNIQVNNDETIASPLLTTYMSNKYRNKAQLKFSVYTELMFYSLAPLLDHLFHP